MIGNSILVDDVKIKKLEIDAKFCDNNATLIIGKRGLGKTYLMMDLIQHFKLFGNINRNVLIFCGNKNQSEYSKISDNVYDNINYNSSDHDNILEPILNEKKYNIEKLKEKMLIVFDDCFFSNTHITNCIKDIIYNGRHYNISIILSIQYPLAISPQLRINFDYVFLFADDCISTQKNCMIITQECFQHLKNLGIHY